MASTKNPRKGAEGQATPVSAMLSFHIKRAEQAIVARKARGVREMDLTEPQCWALSYLTGGASKSVTQLARQALVTSQTMTGIVKNLETKGLVERHPSPDHGRVQLITLTDAGVERAAAANQFAEGVEHGLREAMSEEDYEQLVKLLDRVAELAPEVAAITSE
ncbi:MarR family winged helix-turn-helix transcriptional regulator [Streptomyces sp. NPDC058108]|uniref:MarR family winged helix-turn-helix transcriptional regulator n=1 Tax=unclassified Streptomyces TaxID=2593676 RepID=UPI0036E287D2